MAKNDLSRIRKFSPRSLFLSVLHLVSSTNREGYHFALESVWEILGCSFDVPSKSSLSEARAKVDYGFFEDIFDDSVQEFSSHCRRYRGLRVYGVDGSDLDLPASADVLGAGLRGARWSKKFETYYPKMHVVHAYDVLNGIVRAVDLSSTCSERAGADRLIGELEQKSLSIYDQLFCGHPIFKQHERRGSFFLTRATISKTHTCRSVKSFLKSRRVDQWTKWLPATIRLEEATKVRLIKYRHHKTKEIGVLVTNLPDKFTRLEVLKLYFKRWEVEVSFKDLVDTMKMDQWHSSKLNGILQEVYCLLWLVNAVKMQMNQFSKRSDPLVADYTKANFKLQVNLIIKNIRLLMTGRAQELLRILKYWFERTLERRRHRSRSYPRVVRRYGTGFSVANKVLRAERNLC